MISSAKKVINYLEKRNFNKLVEKHTSTVIGNQTKYIYSLAKDMESIENGKPYCQFLVSDERDIFVYGSYFLNDMEFDIVSFTDVRMFVKYATEHLDESKDSEKWVIISTDGLQYVGTKIFDCCENVSDARKFKSKFDAEQFLNKHSKTLIFGYWKVINVGMKESKKITESKSAFTKEELVFFEYYLREMNFKSAYESHEFSVTNGCAEYYLSKTSVDGIEQRTCLFKPSYFGRNPKGKWIAVDFVIGRNGNVTSPTVREIEPLIAKNSSNFCDFDKYYIGRYAKYDVPHDLFEE